MRTWTNKSLVVLVCLGLLLTPLGAGQKPSRAAEPGETVTLSVRYANHSAATATNVVVIATLHSDLAYAGDTSGRTPMLVGNTVVNFMPDLGFLDNGAFDIRVTLPAEAACGARYPVSVSLSSDGSDYNGSDNFASAEVMASRNVYLPIILKSP